MISQSPRFQAEINTFYPKHGGWFDSAHKWLVSKPCDSDLSLEFGIVFRIAVVSGVENIEDFLNRELGSPADDGNVRDALQSERGFGDDLGRANLSISLGKCRRRFGDLLSSLADNKPGILFGLRRSGRFAAYVCELFLTAG